MDENNEKIFMAVTFSGKIWNIEAANFFEAVEDLKRSTELPVSDPNYLDPKDIFQLIDVPG